MFKPGDKVMVAANKKKFATVTSTSLENSSINTDLGVFDESELLQAETTVLRTAAGATANDLYEEAHEEKNKEGEEAIQVPLSLGFKLRDLIEEKAYNAELEFDFNGHWKNGTALANIKFFVKDTLASFFPMLPSLEEANEVIEAINSGKPLDKWVYIGITVGCGECFYCNNLVRSLETDGKTVRISGNKCPVPEGLPPDNWELNVPSGKIVVANDLRRWFPLPEGEPVSSINSASGQGLTTQAYADVGMSHAFVGNTCPGVFALDNDKYKIATPPHEEYWDKDKKEWLSYENPPPFEGKELAGVCTDLWWYSMCDLEEFGRRAKKFGSGSLKDANATVIDVKPGVYRFTHYNEIDRDVPDECIFSEFEWVRDPDPVRDYLAEYDSYEVNAHAYVQAQARDWPTLYGTAYRIGDKNKAWVDMTEEQRRNSWRSVADQTFCTIGAGIEWHEKGFPTAKVDQNVEDIEPPSFRYQTSWYPFSSPYGGLFEVENLSPSFASLAFRVLESVISFGIIIHDYNEGKSRDVDGTRKRMLVAVNRYRELAKKHPKEADHEYVQWLSQPGRAEAWVERFDLGPPDVVKK